MGLLTISRLLRLGGNVGHEFDILAPPKTGRVPVAVAGRPSGTFPLQSSDPGTVRDPHPLV